MILLKRGMAPLNGSHLLEDKGIVRANSDEGGAKKSRANHTG